MKAVFVALVIAAIAVVYVLGSWLNPLYNETANFTPELRYLTVYSDQGEPVPAVGTHEFHYGEVVEANCGPNPYPADEGARYFCMEHTGTGDITDTFETNISFVIHHNSSVTWLWVWSSANDPNPPDPTFMEGAIPLPPTYSPVITIINNTNTEGISYPVEAAIGEVIILFDYSVTDEQAMSMISNLGGSVLSKIPKGGLYHVQVPNGTEISFILAMRLQEGVIFAELNQQLQLAQYGGGIV